MSDAAGPQHMPAPLPVTGECPGLSVAPSGLRLPVLRLFRILADIAGDSRMGSGAPEWLPETQLRWACSLPETRRTELLLVSVRLRLRHGFIP